MNIASFVLALATATSSFAAGARPVLLDFHADWCPPCQKMRPVVAQLEEKGYPVKSVNVDQNPELSKKYNIQGVPAFIVVDSEGNELDRTEGLQPAKQLAEFYLQARSKASPPSNSRAHANGSDDEDAEEAEDSEPSRGVERTAARDAETEFKNPMPWESSVRIKVLSDGYTGFGSGTIIHSTPDEAIILTCAHIFKLEKQRQVPPKKFPLKIVVDLFDGQLHGKNPPQVHFVENVEGKALDYDFDLDVGLIRIRPERRLPSSRVVPIHWTPKERMGMMTVGCSGGEDASPWRTQIKNARMKGLAGKPNYEAIECSRAPKQGRSGGGLFTDDGYIAGVCNFAEPQGNHGLYATPRSIYSILDRNNLMALYSPVSSGSGTLLASGEGRTRNRGNSPDTIVRGQSPAVQDDDPYDNKLTIPPYEMVSNRGSQPARRASNKGKGWGSDEHIAQREPSRSFEPAPAAKLGSPEAPDQTQATDLNLDPEVDNDRFSRFDADEQNVNAEDVPVKAPSTKKSRWRPASSANEVPISKADDE